MTINDPTFEDRLLAQLRAVVAAQPEPAAVPAPAAARPRLSRRGVTAGGALTATAAAAVLAIVLAGGSGAQPAYAVDRHADGSVTVTINDARDASGLERELRAAGVPAVVRDLPEGKTCKAASTAGHPGQPLTVGVGSGADGATTFTVAPRQLRDGQTLVVGSSPGPGRASVSVSVADGPVGPCELVSTNGPAGMPGGASLDQAPDGADDGPTTRRAAG